MKNLLSISFVALCVTSSALIVNAQKTTEAKPKATPTEQQKNQNSGTSAVLSPTTPSESAETAVPNSSSASETKATETYKVGIGDILDVRFMNSANAGRSTLFTVVAGGMIDFPAAGGPIMVAGLTTDQIQSRIAAELKRRAIDEGAQISVGVRQYVSHSVLVTGLIGSPGARILRREAVPLYVVLAESQLRNDAGRVVILRGSMTGQPLDLSDPSTLNTTVVNGDVITVSGKPQEFYYIAGRITYPGQKNYQTGITLLQAILAAGGTQKNDSKVEISREGAGKRLVTTRYNLKDIKGGVVEDPKILAGDRIEVLR